MSKNDTYVHTLGQLRKPTENLRTLEEKLMARTTQENLGLYDCLSSLVRCVWRVCLSFPVCHRSSLFLSCDATLLRLSRPVLCRLLLSCFASLGPCLAWHYPCPVPSCPISPCPVLPCLDSALHSLICPVLSGPDPSLSCPGPGFPKDS